MLVSLQGFERFLNQLASQLFLRIRGNAGRSDDVHDAIAKYDAIGADHFSDGNSRGDLNGRDTCLF